MNLVIYNIKKGIRVLDSFAEKLSADEENNIERVNALSDVVQVIKMLDKSLVLFAVENKAQLKQTIILIRKLKPAIKKGYIRISGFNLSGNPKVELLLKKEGILDLLELDLTDRSFAYKLNMWDKGLKEKGSLSGDQSGSTVKDKKADREAKLEKEIRRTGIRYIGPLDLQEDVWIIKSKKDCKRVLKRFLIKLLGPGPNEAKWVEIVNKADPKNKYWYFKPIRSESALITEQGQWIFCGQKPEFDWKSNRWVFAGENITLFFKNGASLLTRFKLESGILNICENSVSALNKESEIIKSIDKETVFTDEEKKAQGQDSFENEEAHEKSSSEFEEDEIEKEKKKHFDDELDYGGKLKGKGSGETLDYGPAKGKSKTQHLDFSGLDGDIAPDAVNTDPLAGDIAPDAMNTDPLAGDIAPDDMNRDPLQENNTKNKKQSAVDYEFERKKKQAPIMEFEDPASKSGQELSYEDDDEKKQADLFKDGSASKKMALAEDYEEKAANERGAPIDFDSGPIDGALLDEGNDFDSEGLDLDDEFEMAVEDISLESGRLESKIYLDSGDEIICQLGDFLDENLTLLSASPLDDYEQEKEYDVQMNFEYGESNALVRFNALVQSFDEFDGEYYYNFILSEFNNKKLENFMKLYEERQKHINLFIKKAQGRI